MLMTMTTGGRFDYWRVTMNTLARLTYIRQVIDRCVIIDDGSPEVELAAMKSEMAQLLPETQVTIVSNNDAGRFRHSRSMQMWYRIVESEQIVFHCEDDWGFQYQYDEKLPFEWALHLIERNDWIGQACMTMLTHNNSINPNAEFWVPTVENTPRFLPTKFTLNPSVIRVSSVHRAGQFRDVDGFESEYGSRWMLGGYSTVYHPVGFCSHIGVESAYSINGSSR